MGKWDRRLKESQVELLRSGLLKGTSFEQVCKMRKSLEEKTEEACHTCIYTRNFITAIKIPV